MSLSRWCHESGAHCPGFACITGCRLVKRPEIPTNPAAAPTPRTDAACAPQSSAYLMFQEVVRVSRELERHNAVLRELLREVMGQADEHVPSHLLPLIRAAIAKEERK